MSRARGHYVGWSLLTATAHPHQRSAGMDVDGQESPKEAMHVCTMWVSGDRGTNVDTGTAHSISIYYNPCNLHPPPLLQDAIPMRALMLSPCMRPFTHHHCSPERTGTTRLSCSSGLLTSFPLSTNCVSPPGCSASSQVGRMVSASGARCTVNTRLDSHCKVTQTGGQECATKSKAQALSLRGMAQGEHAARLALQVRRDHVR